MKAGGGVKVNPKRKRVAVIGGITISKEGIGFSFSTHKKPSLNSKDIILYLRKVMKDEKTVTHLPTPLLPRQESSRRTLYNTREKLYKDFNTLIWDAKRFLRLIYKRVNDLNYSVERCGELWTSILNEITLPFKF
ncbi:hypothetical protein YN1HA_29870 [Sulfurisphaera ohwakuensis]